MEPINYQSHTSEKMYTLFELPDRLMGTNTYTFYDEVVPHFISNEYTFDINGEVVFKGFCLGKGPYAISNFAKEKDMDIDEAVLFLYNNKLKECRDEKLSFILS